MSRVQIVYGTTNPAKIAWMKKRLKNLNVDIIGIGELEHSLPEVCEDGKDPLENAIKKAKEYYRVIRRPVFSADSGVFFDEVTESEQPGTMIRRVAGRTLDDVQMIDHYASLARKYGGRITGQYRNALAFVIDEDTIFTCYDDGIASRYFYLVDEPHSSRREGFPMDSLSVDIETGEYYFDLAEGKYDIIADNGYEAFFAEVMQSIDERTDDE